MKSILKLLVLSILATAYSCGSAGKSVADIAAPAEMAMSAKMVDYDEVATEESSDEGMEQPRDESPAPDRKIIKMGEISFETSDPVKTGKSILQAVSEAGGYISNDNVSDYGDRVTHSLTIRVPAVEFDALLHKIEGNARKLEHKSIQSMDVTEEFVDIEARVKTKKELEVRYMELLRQASSVEDILAIERQAGELRSEIESIEGRLRYLTDRVAYSTLTVSYYEEGSSAFGFGSKFKVAVESGWDNMLWFFIGLIHIWPFLLVILLSALILRMYAKRTKARKKQKRGE